MNVNYKQKYENLKAQYMNAVDTAFRLGFEAGSQQAQMDQVAQQAQQQAELEQAAAMGQQPGAPGEEAPQDGAPGQEQAPMSEHPEGSELDQHIAKLESMLGKSETSPEDLKKAFDEVKSLRKSQKLAADLRKGDAAIKSIAKAINGTKSFNVAPKASQNVSHAAKAALTMQEKIVENIMKGLEAGEQDVSAGVASLLGNEGLIKKE